MEFNKPIFILAIWFSAHQVLSMPTLSDPTETSDTKYALASFVVTPMRDLLPPDEINLNTKTSLNPSIYLSRLEDFPDDESTFEDDFEYPDCAVRNIHAGFEGSKVKSIYKKVEDGYYYGYYFFPHNMKDHQFRIEKSITLNRGTPEEELVVKGVYGYNLLAFDYVVFYVVDKRGYKSKVHVKKYNPNCTAIVPPTAPLLKNLT